MTTIDPLWIAFTCHDYSEIQAWNNMNISNNGFKLGIAESKLLNARKPHSDTNPHSGHKKYVWEIQCRWTTFVSVIFPLQIENIFLEGAIA